MSNFAGPFYNRPTPAEYEPSEKGRGMSRDELYENDQVWAMFYRDGKNLGEIALEFNVSVYDLSPWLTAPLVQAYSKLPPKPSSEETK